MLRVKYLSLEFAIVYLFYVCYMYTQTNNVWAYHVAEKEIFILFDKFILFTFFVGIRMHKSFEANNLIHKLGHSG